MCTLGICYRKYYFRRHSQKLNVNVIVKKNGEFNKKVKTGISRRRTFRYVLLSTLFWDNPRTSRYIHLCVNNERS